jgi:RimJ/RimL family protein N-acetyltransferase
MPLAEIQTQHLKLQPLRAQDLSRLIEIAGLKEIADTTISVPHPFEDRDARAWLEHYSTNAENLGWGIYISDPDTYLVGFIALNHIDRTHEQAEISFWIDPSYSGRGYVTEAARAILQYAASRLNLHRVEAYHMKRNLGSGRVLQKLGFEHEGTLKGRVLKWGVREDVHLWAKLAT